MLEMPRQCEEYGFKSEVPMWKRRLGILGLKMQIAPGRWMMVMMMMMVVVVVVMMMMMMMIREKVRM